MKFICLTFALVLCLADNFLIAQNIAISNDGSSPDSSAILDVHSTTKGVLLPRLDSLQRKSITNAATGLLVYDTDTQSFWFKGNDGWVELVNNAEGLRDCDMDTKIEVESAPDEDTIRFTVSGANVARLDDKTLHLESQNKSVFIGKNAGANDVSNTGENVFLGHQAGYSNTIGYENTATGFQALYSNQSGLFNVAYGNEALRSNLDGWSNVAFGTRAMQSNSTGWSNTAIGYQSLQKNSSGDGNVGLGRDANFYNTSGSNNTIIGHKAGFGPELHSKSGNVFIGYQAGRNDTTDNKLYIENSNSDAPLIYGDFTDGSELVGINGRLGIGTQEPDYAMHIKEDGTGDSVQTVVAVLESSNSQRPLLLFSENFLNTLTSGMSIEYNGAAGINTSNELYINKLGGVPMVTFENSGNVGIGMTDPNTKLHIEQGSDVAINGGGYVTLGNINGSNIAMDNNEIMARNNGAAADIFINNDGGRIGIGVSTVNISDRLHVNSNPGQNPFRVQVNMATKLRVFENGGTSLGVNTTPPPNGLHIEGDMYIRGDDIDADGTLRINSPTKIELIVGTSKVTVETTGITISSPSNINFNATGNIIMSADGMIDLDAGTELELNAGTTMDINSANLIDMDGLGSVRIDGPTVRLNGGGAGAARIGSSVSSGSVTSGSSTVLIGN